MTDNSNKIKLGPSWIKNGDKRMMIMTPPINTFLFEFDSLTSPLKSNMSLDVYSLDFQNLFNSTLNNLIAGLLIYFQNRLGLTLGKEIKITSVPSVKAMFIKHFQIDIKTLIGDKGYKELKKLDEIRGKNQHKNDRYFGVYRVNKSNICSVKDLFKYSEKVRDIIIDLDNKLEKIKPLYDVKVNFSDNQISIETKAIGHSFDINELKINKKD